MNTSFRLLEIHLLVYRIPTIFSYNPRLFITSSELAVGSVSTRHNDGAPVPIHFNAIDFAMLSCDKEVREQDDNEGNVDDIYKKSREKRGQFQINDL